MSRGLSTVREVKNDKDLVTVNVIVSWQLSKTAETELLHVLTQ